MLMLELQQQQKQKENQIKLVNHMATFVCQATQRDREREREQERAEDRQLQAGTTNCCMLCFLLIFGAGLERSQLEMRPRQVIVF